jgi:hypothetical protein
MPKIILTAVALCCLVLGLTGQTRSLDANPDVRAVHGVVTDAGDAPVKGAVVYLENTKDLQIRTFISGGDGEYHFAGLSANIDYKLHAEHKDRSSGTKTLSSFNTKKDAVVNLKLR